MTSKRRVLVRLEPKVTFEREEAEGGGWSFQDRRLQVQKVQRDQCKMGEHAGLGTMYFQTT
jgi:hypothetical protein